MSKVLIIISKEQFSSNKTKLALKLASKIREKGHSTTIFLIEDGAYLAYDNQLNDLINSGIAAKVEEWDLKARGLKGKVNPNVGISNIDDLFAEISEKNEKVFWF